MVRADYWDVTDEQVVEKTGHPLAHWAGVIAPITDRKSNDIVAHLQSAHGVPRYWARALTTWYLKQAGRAG